MDALALAWAVATIPLLYYVWQVWGLLGLVLEVGTDDGQFAARTFVSLLNDASRTMLICDDGNDAKWSIYNDRAACDAVDSRLQTNPELQLRCLFSSDDETLFTRRFADHPRVNMQRGMSPRRSIHFRIIDEGKKGYVSSHPPGGGERYRFYDCSRVPQRIRDEALGRHVRDMQARFASTKAAAVVSVGGMGVSR